MVPAYEIIREDVLMRVIDFVGVSTTVTGRASAFRASHLYPFECWVFSVFDVSIKEWMSLVL